ncbi:sterol desaturase family protein [Gordonia rubripertincta]|uniref:sterol desaturase family protein n=1 Tax=Gordonia rubripertincta TaxID=36822 RepID=UPI00117F4185|nr:sterol desaturase family protein [Gordonia rubripertincta]TSD95936.1 sterol desaturase family protein [Gordonia rubripertincta]
MLEFLPEPMREPTVIAIPFFLAMLAIEWFAAAKLEHDHDDEGAPAPGAYETRDARASVMMGVVSIGTSAFWKLLGLLAYTALFTYVAPWHLPMNQWYSWVIAFVAVDFIYYWVHRVSHRVRIVWATHQAHHSSEYFNFATALRQKWNISAAIVMWLPLPLLGVPPALVFFAYSLNLIYQFWIHTEHINKMWAPFEYVFNTPSHHRVHHGRDPEYLDRNYGGVFIIWDRIFGSFTPEGHRPRYGLTKPVDTYNIWRLETHEYVAIARDVKSTSSWRARLGYIFGPPGWTPKTGASTTEPMASGTDDESVSPENEPVSPPS